MDFFHNFGNLFQPLEFVPASREHVVPTEWQVRSVLGDCTSRATVISTRAPQYRQHALISDFLDHAKLSIQEKAALATSWIKGFTLQNLALASMTGPSSTKSIKHNCRCKARYLTNASLWAQGNNRSFTGIHRQLQDDFVEAYDRSSMSFLAEHALPLLYVKALSAEILTSLRPVMNLLLGYSSGRPVQHQLA